MRAVRLVAWKHEPEMQEVPEPEPGPGEVVVKVGAPGCATPTSISSTTSSRT